MQHKKALGLVIVSACVFALIFSFAPARAAEFTADIFITGPGDNYTFKLHVRDNMYRLQKIKGPQMMPPYPTIVNRDTAVTWGLNPQVKQYVEIADIEKTIMVNPLVGWAATRKNLTEKAGPAETLNGYECKTWLYTEAGKSEPAAKVWFSESLGHVLREERFGLNKNPVLELRNIQEGPLDPSLFEVPAGYTKLDMDAGQGSKPSGNAQKQVVDSSTESMKPKAEDAELKDGSGNLIFILDASGSMWGQVEGKAKIAIAKEVLTGLIKDLPDDAVVGLVAYGHRRKGDCNDVEELVPLGKVDKNKLITTVQGLSPKGKTPISRSVRMTAERIKHVEDETTIILVSDGKETCDPDPCGLVKELKAAGIRFVMHVIGFDVTEEEKAQLECMARAGGGEYFTAKTAKDFQMAAKEVVKKASEKPPVSLQVTCIKDEKPIKAYVQVLTRGGEKHVAESWTSIEKPAAFRLPPGMYDIRAQDQSVIQRPTVDIKDVEIVEGQTAERVAVFSTGGILHVKAIKNNATIKAYVKVLRQQDDKYIRDGWTREDGTPAEFKLLPDMYKISVQDDSVVQRPVIWIENIEIKPDQTAERYATFVAGGVLKVTATREGAPYKAYVKIYQQQDDKYMRDGWTREDGRAAECKLLPGAYYAKVEDRKERSVREIRDIQVRSGETITVNAAFPVEEEQPTPAPVPAPQAQPEAAPAPAPTTSGGGTPPPSTGEPTAGSDTIMNGEVPLIQGTKVLKTMTYGPSSQAALEVPATPQDIIDFYKQAMPAKGWQPGMAMVQGNKGVLQMTSGKGQLMFKIEGNGESSKVSIVLVGQ